MKQGLVLNAVLGCLAAGLVGCGVPAEDGPADSFGIDFSLPQEATAEGGIIIFLVDGVNAETFGQLLSSGQLPAIQKYFLDRGLFVPHAVASHPSLTMNNLMSIMTGQFSGHTGLVAAKYFDRDRLIFRHFETIQDKNKLDQECRVPTLYQQFPGRETYSLFLQPHCGATRWYENRLSAGPAVAFDMYRLVDRIALYRLGDVMDHGRRCRQFPGLCAIYQLSVNFSAYQYQASSEQYREAIRNMDRQIGRVMGDLQRAGRLEKTVVAFVSDHGHCDTPLHGRIGDLIDSLGITAAAAQPLGEEWPFQSRQRYFNRFMAVPYGAGDRYWSLYLRKPIEKAGKITYADWPQRPTPQEMRNYPTPKGRFDLPIVLAKQEYVDAVAYASGPGTVRVLRPGGGEVEFRDESQAAEARESRISYHLVQGKDPLGWAGKVPAAALAGAPMSGRQWLEATVDTDYPDLPTGLLSFFDGKLGGDIAVFPQPQWDFDGWRKAGHGGIRNFECLSPMLIAGPNIPHGRIPFGRTVDLMPTVLEAVGRPVPAGLDGHSLLRNPHENQAGGN